MKMRYARIHNQLRAYKRNGVVCVVSAAAADSLLVQHFATDILKPFQRVYDSFQFFFTFFIKI